MVAADVSLFAERRAMDDWPHELLADERVPMRAIQDAARQAGLV